nr:hypothetical protein [Tanacetum cinerariifolium]
DLLRACPHHGFTELHQLDTFYNALNPTDQDSLNSAAGGNLLETRTQDVLTIIENKSKVRNSRNKSIVSQVKSSDANTSSSSEIAKLTHSVNHGAHPYYQCLAAGGNTFLELQDNIQGYVTAAAVNYNQGSGHLPSNTIANPKGELKSITTRSGIVVDGPSVLIHPPFINPKEDERVEETLMDQDLAEDPLHPNIPYPSRMHKQNQQEKDEVQIHKFWQMFKQFHINITLADDLILISKYQKMLKALLSNKEKLLEPLKCKALADLGASINLMPLFVWKNLGLPELISTRMTLKQANRAIYTPAGITRDIFVSVGKFTFPADFVIVDYESDPRVPLILGRPFLRTAYALIDIHGQEMILRDDDERLTLNMRHDTSSYSNQPQKESINMINFFNDLSEDFLEDLFATNYQSGNPTFSSHLNLTSPEVKDGLFDPEGGNVLIEKLLDLDSTKDLHPLIMIRLMRIILLILMTILLIPCPSCSPMNMHLTIYPLRYTMNMMMIFFEVESDTEYVYDDPFDSNGEKIKESKLLIDELDIPSDFLPSPEYGSFLLENFSEVDALPSTNNEDKVFNLGILIQENLLEVITHVTSDKNAKKLAISHAFLILEDLILLFMNFLSLKKFPMLKLHSRFHLKIRKKFSSPRFTLLKKFILFLSQNYLIRAIKFSKSLKFLKA